MSDLNGNFTFRLSEADKIALTHVAARLGCDRGAALRRLIRRASAPLERKGQFVAQECQFQIRLISPESES